MSSAGSGPKQLDIAAELSFEHLGEHVNHEQVFALSLRGLAEFELRRGDQEAAAAAVDGIVDALKRTPKAMILGVAAVNQCLATVTQDGLLSNDDRERFIEQQASRGTMVFDGRGTRI